MIIAALFVAFCASLALVVGLKSWGRPEEGGSEWASALAPELAPSPVEVIFAPGARIVRAVEHVGASEAAPAAGAIGTLAARPSDDLLTFEQQVTGEPDEWAWFQQAMVAYENALLTVRRWPGELGVKSVESTQQRIDRWLREGGDGVRAARSEARKAASDTWDAPSGQLPVLDSYVADRMAEALLAS